jgi:AraC-like DNA-binding protein
LSSSTCSSATTKLGWQKNSNRTGELMYFHTLAALNRLHGRDDVLFDLVAQGRISVAVGKAQEALGNSVNAQKSQASALELATICGDLLLTQDRDEEADDSYRLALKLCASGPRGSVRVLSRRNAGMLSLYQHRLGPAAACFGRIIEDEDASSLQRIEAHFGLAWASHCMGQTSRALDQLDTAADLIDSADKSGQMLLNMLRADLLVQRDLRAHIELQDHVFWRVPARVSVQMQQQPEPLTAARACMTAYEPYAVVAQRARHLQDLVLASCGDTAALRRAEQHHAWLRQAGLVAAERQARLETALVAITARQVDIARAMIEPLCARASEGPVQRWNVELVYCQAKVHALSGRIDDSLKCYQRYALESVQCLRAETVEPLPAQPGCAVEGGSGEEIELRLPAKYRRAYRFMIQNLDNAELSVHQVADEIGITERALQSMFKAQLGMTPAEVMRRCRIERIRQDLLRDTVTGATVIEVAARWGIRNRSTLVTLYRRYFHETPAETLAGRPASRGDLVAQVA